jgi:ATP-binding cassette subfamily B protein
MNAFTHEDFSGIRVVQSFAAENGTSNTFYNLLKEQRKAFVRAVRMADFFWPIVDMSWG